MSTVLFLDQILTVGGRPLLAAQLLLTAQSERRTTTTKMAEQTCRTQQFSAGSGSTSGAGVKPVPMKLFSTWEIDKSTPSCIPR